MTAKKRFALQVIATAGGLGILGFLLWQVGVTAVIDHLREIGWYAPLLLLPYLAVALCDAAGWAHVFPATVSLHRVPLVQLSLIRLAGEAINNLTPTAALGGEPVKVYLLRSHGITTDAGLASVIVAKTALTVSQILFILCGIPFFLDRLGWVEHAWWILGGLLILAVGFITLLIRWQRHGLMGATVRGLQRVLPNWQRLARWEERAGHIDAHLLTLYDGDYRQFLTATVYHAIGWFLGVVEVMLFFSLMGVTVTPVEALIIETMVQPIHSAALFIPGALGVQEVGGVYLCRLLGLDDSAGLTLMALKRAREAVYNMIGLAVLAHVSGSVWPRQPEVNSLGES